MSAHFPRACIPSHRPWPIKTRLGAHTTPLAVCITQERPACIRCPRLRLVSVPFTFRLKLPPSLLPSRVVYALARRASYDCQNFHCENTGTHLHTLHTPLSHLPENQGTRRGELVEKHHPQCTNGRHGWAFGVVDVLVVVRRPQIHTHTLGKNGVRTMNMILGRSRRCRLLTVKPSVRGLVRLLARVGGGAILCTTGCTVPGNIIF